MPTTAGEGNPWRRIFEEVRRALGNRRDETGVLGSINWLRKGMAERGANPNVVRNIIYRDKGKLSDKRVLYSLLSELWESTGRPPLRVPELEVLLAAPSEGDQEVMQLLGREKRRAYQAFVSSVRQGGAPKLLIIGRPGSGKTLLTDYIQQALELPPRAPLKLVRQEFSSQDLAASLSRLALALGVPAEVFESRLVRIGAAGAFSVQADAQADVARVIIERVRSLETPLALLLHISQSLPSQDVLGNVPLRLSTPEVPRVSVTEWLWITLIEPLSRLNVALLVSMSELPLSLTGRTGAFEGPVKLSPPTANEARRFVKARVPHLSAEQQEALVARARRSFEDLRTLTLLAEAREPLPEGGASSKHVEGLSQLALHSGDARLRDFLGALAVLSLPEFPTFERDALSALRTAEPADLNALEAAFLDPVPGDAHLLRSFSRQLSRALRARLQAHDPERFRALSRRAAQFYEAAAHAAPRSEAATRYLHHLFAARAWDALVAWARAAAVPQSLIQRVWGVAQSELGSDPKTLEAVAFVVASHYLKLGSVDHPDVVRALDLLAASDDPDRRAWTALKRAESAVMQGAFERAETLVSTWSHITDPVLRAEALLVRASIARWRSHLGEAAQLTRQSAEVLEALGCTGERPKLLSVKVAIGSGLVAKDQGDLEGALAHFARAVTDDDLLRARLAFQRGDVQLALGRFAEAQGALDEAVRLSYRGEAPAAERARYLARRGTLGRRRGAYGSAEADFAAARAVLGPPEEASPRLSLEHLKVRDEAALNRLAQGDFEGAVFDFGECAAAFSAYGAHFGVDSSFRVLRSTLRLALAYGCRALKTPYRLPFLPPLAYFTGEALPQDRTHPDLQHARELLKRVRLALAAAGSRYRPLHLQEKLVSSLFDPPETALEAAAAAAAQARYPYQTALTHAHLAAALLRAGDPAGQLGGVLVKAWEALPKAAPPEEGDGGVRAWLLALSLLGRWRSGERPPLGETLAEALRDPLLAPYHEGLLRFVGELAEADPPRWRAQLEAVLGPLADPSGLRLSDALVLQWRARHRGADADEESGRGEAQLPATAAEPFAS